MNKAELRRMLRARFEGAAIRDRQSLHLCRRITESDLYKSARVIGGYMPMAHEADITPVLNAALQQGKAVALPLCKKAPDMSFHKVASLGELRIGAYGLLEPADDAEVVPVEDIDLLLVPLEGIDGSGFRLGKGGGYYDKALSACQGMTLGCALSWQWTDEIPRDPWDVRLHACADADGIHMFIL